MKSCMVSNAFCLLYEFGTSRCVTQEIADCSDLISGKLLCDVLKFRLHFCLCCNLKREGMEAICNGNRSCKYGSMSCVETGLYKHRFLFIYLFIILLRLLLIFYSPESRDTKPYVIRYLNSTYFKL